jgi:hypothetical protein
MGQHDNQNVVRWTVKDLPRPKPDEVEDDAH